MSAIFRTTIATMIIIAFDPGESSAQFAPSKFEIGINLGTLVYQGDLAASALGYTSALKPAIGIWASKSLDDYFSLRVNITRGAIGADESTYTSPAWRKFRAFKFNSTVTEFSGMLVWDLFGKTYREGFRRLSPYFLAGAGITVLNVHRNWSGFDAAYFGPKSTAVVGLGVDTLHHTPGIVPVLPLGAGIRYMLTNHIYLNAEAIYRLTPSDYIDGFKYAADPTKNDHYYGVTIGASYRFGSDRNSCPKVKY
jgi:hypothetical protein